MRLIPSITAVTLLFVGICTVQGAILLHPSEAAAQTIYHASVPDVSSPDPVPGGPGIPGISQANLTLIQPLDDTTTSLPVQPGLGMLFAYFNISWPWLLGVAAGIAIFWGMIGGVEIMFAGSNSGLRDKGKDRMMWALAGLLLVGLAQLILQTLNPLFFK